MSKIVASGQVKIGFVIYFLINLKLSTAHENVLNADQKGIQAMLSLESWYLIPFRLKKLKNCLQIIENVLQDKSWPYIDGYP